MEVLRSITKIAINRLGYDVRRVAVPTSVHIADADADPITFDYMPSRRGHAVMEVAIKDARAFQSLALRLRPECHPFVRAIECALRESGREPPSAIIEQVLRGYYASVCPATAADVLGVPPDDIPGLRGFTPNSEDPPIEYAAPWSGRSPAELKEGRRRTAAFEGLQNGVLASADDGVTSFGPVKPAKMQLEIRRLSRLFESVRMRGFDRLDPRAPLQVSAFRRDGEYRWVINSGQHRFATAAAFGLESVLAMIIEVVRREDAALWPQVVSGIFTQTGAESIFDRIFDGVPAPVCRDWIEFNSGREDRCVADG